MSEELKPCPFCGCKYGQHESNCYIYMLATHERFDAVNHGTLFNDNELEQAWNQRTERTCQIIECDWDNGQCTWGCRCTKCGKRFEHERGTTWNYCPNCGARVERDDA